MNTKQLNFRFWLLWLLASVVGLAVGFAVYFPLIVSGDDDQGVLTQLPIAAVAGAVLGATVGLAQALVLRRRLVRPGLWPLATAAGGLVGGAAALAAGESVSALGNFAITLGVGGAALGACLGLAQWLVLRRQLAQAGWWVLASAVGLGVGLFLSRAVAEPLALALIDSGRESAGYVVGTILFVGLMLLGYGAITGGALVWLWRRPGASTTTPAQSVA